MNQATTVAVGEAPFDHPASGFGWGFFDAEPDFSKNGVWVTSRASLWVDLSGGIAVEVHGLYFPELVDRQLRNEQSTLACLVDGRSVIQTTLRKHGAFSLRFEVASDIAQGPHELCFECSGYFKPSEIGEGTDDRKLAWRFKRLVIGNTDVFDCTRRYNYLAIEAASRCVQSAAGQKMHFHLDTPGADSPRLANGRIVVAGWAFDTITQAAAPVRVLLGPDVFTTRSMERDDVRNVFARQFANLSSSTGFSTALAVPTGSCPLQVQLFDGAKWICVSAGLLYQAPIHAARDEQDIIRSTLEWALSISKPAQELSRTLEDRRFQFHLDTPRIGPVNIIKEGALFSGWAVDFGQCKPARVRFVVGKDAHMPQVMQRPDVQQTFASAGALPFDTGFALVLSLPMGAHRMRIELETAPNAWTVVAKVLLFRVPGTTQAQRAQPALTYAEWARLSNERLAEELPEIVRHITVMVERPVFSIVVRAADNGHDFDETFRSVRLQIYPHHEICVWVAPGQVPPVRLPHGVRVIDALAEVSGDFIVLLEQRQRLTRQALYEFASALNQFADTDLVYGDEGVLTSRGAVSRPFHKPVWSPDYIETFNYIGFAACFRTSVAANCFEARGQHDFVLRFTERTSGIRHVAKVLGHAPYVPATRRMSGPERDESEGVQALQGRLRRTGRVGTVIPHPLHGGCFDIRLALQREPLVSIIIPSAGRTIELDGRRIDLLPNIVRQIHQRSTYRNFEVIVIDNGDLAPAQLALLQELRCKRITYTNPVFNISEKLNLGATLAEGEMFLLMNDDIEILTPDWIERLLEQFEKPHVGVVGAKLLYPFGATQHVGVVHNGGNPDHVRRLFPKEDAGYFFSTCGVRNFSAVTGACMMARARDYRKVGGYSEDLAVSFNDVDFCMKIRRQGLYAVYAPGAELTHMESVSRVGSLNMKELLWYHRQWAAELVSDGFYPERFLTVAPPSFEPSINFRQL